MNVVIAMDSFKGNLNSREVAVPVAQGIRRVFPQANIKTVAIADGGEGTTEALVDSLAGEYVSAKVHNPVMKKIDARYGIINKNTAVMEMAEASGICLLDKSELNPMVATTYGTGEMIADALRRGCTKIILGIGSSATNDGGAGMAQALGFRLTDKNGENIPFGGGGLKDLEHIDATTVDPLLQNAEILVACDVKNPLCGENGASNVYGRQKGATEEMVKILDSNLKHFAEVICRDFGKNILTTEGSGAAGGLGGGLLSFCGAQLIQGIDLILDTVKADEFFQWADVVITGEGRLDGQTIYGKVPVGVAQRAKKYNKPVFAIAGFLDDGAELVYNYGIDSIVSSMVGPMSLQDAIERSPKLLEQAGERLFRVIRCFMKE